MAPLRISTAGLSNTRKGDTNLKPTELPSSPHTPSKATMPLRLSLTEHHSTAVHLPSHTAANTPHLSSMGPLPPALGYMAGPRPSHRHQCRYPVALALTS
jgi:hypothetical protein